MDYLAREQLQHFVNTLLTIKRREWFVNKNNWKLRMNWLVFLIYNKIVFEKNLDRNRQLNQKYLHLHHWIKNTYICITESKILRLASTDLIQKYLYLHQP